MFSQRDEEQVILDHFGDRVGTFLDVGAYDGITFSNTHALALKGWSGVCVEASPSCFVKLMKILRTHFAIPLHTLVRHLPQDAGDAGMGILYIVNRVITGL